MVLAGWIINMIGLVVSVVGTVLIYKGTPLDSTGHTILAETYVTNDEYQKSHDEMTKRNRSSRLGIGVLLSGFVIQAIAQVLMFQFN
ncbi:hypothetical protein ACFCW7_00015 [Paenibacillus glucanolyticus]|uniref:hypothetical protein n=1 Tax=Paenibacillus glucanolyticus TaxID=59843 RepID=UPI0035E32293